MASARKEYQLIQSSIQPDSKEKKGTLIVKCDDIGDFIIWQDSFQKISEYAEKPIYFVGNQVLKALVEDVFDYADEYIWVDKNKWGEESYRKDIYKTVANLSAHIALEPMFTRNFFLDDYIMRASGAKKQFAWNGKFNSDLDYHPDFDVVGAVYIDSDEPMKNEYLRNFEFVHRVYNCEVVTQFNPKFTGFKKQNRLAITPVASKSSRSWSKESMAKLIEQVLPVFDSVVLLGGKDSIEACQYIEKYISSSKLLNMGGQCSLNETLAFIGESDMLFSADTFSVHMAMMTDTATVALSNGKNWQRFLSYDRVSEKAFKVIFPRTFKKDWDNLKVYTSGSEIKSIPVADAVDAIKAFKSKKISGG